MRDRSDRLLRQVEALTRRLKVRQRQWSATELARVYRAAAAEVLGPDARFTAIDRNAVQVIVERMLADVDIAVEGIPRDLRRALVRTRQEAVEDPALLRQVGAGKALGLTREETARRIASTLRDGATRRLRGRVSPDVAERLRQIAAGQYVPIVDRRGWMRRFRLRQYARLVGHTWAMAASNEGTLRAAPRLGTDLVQVSVHTNVPDEACQRIQGKVFSISGASPDFPPMGAVRLPVHPNCRHRWVPVNADTLRERGQYELLSAFSRDESATVGDLAEYRRRITDLAQRRQLPAGSRDRNEGTAGNPREGVHFRQVESTLAARDTPLLFDNVIKAGMLEYLERHPLEKLELIRTFGRYRRPYQRAFGLYDPLRRVLSLRLSRKKGTWGAQFHAGENWSISTTGQDRLEALGKTFVHELSHHLHRTLQRAGIRTPEGQDVDVLIREAYRRGRPITKYAGTSWEEYWAETHTAYVFSPDELRVYDPVGYDMVKRVRQLAGIE